MASVAKPTKRQMATLVLRALYSPSVIFAFLVVLTLPYWCTVAIYLFMKSLIHVPGGQVIWLFCVVCAGISLSSWVGFFVDVFRLSKRQRALRLAAERGDVEAGKQYSIGQFSILPQWKFALAFITLQMLIPAFFALFYWQSMNEVPALIKEQGKLRYERPQESLARTLRNLERKGIFTPMMN